MPEKEKYDIEEIMIDVISGETLSLEKEMFFKEWLKEDDNRKEFYRYQCLHDALLAIRMKEKTDGTEILEKIISERRSGRSIRRWLSYAAGVACLVGFALLFFLFKVNQSGEQENAMTQLKNEVQQEIVLTLSNGKRILLSDSVGSIQAPDGAVIHHSKENGLVYDSLASTSQLIYNTISIPRGAEYKLLFADGTTVWLNSESEITYPVSFNGDSREVRLKGEAYFDVSKNKKRPFIVHTENFDVRVTGTEFNVRVYPGETESATLAEGGIQMEQGGEVYSVLPGQQASLVNGEMEIKEVDLAIAIAWRHHAFSFIEQPLEEIMNELARWYDVEVFYMSPNVKELHFTAWFRRNSTLEEVIEVFEKTRRINIQLKGKTMTITQRK